MPKAPPRLLPTLDTLVVSIVSRGPTPIRQAAFTSLKDAQDYVVSTVPVESNSPFHAYTIIGLSLQGQVVTVESGDNALLISCRH